MDRKPELTAMTLLDIEEVQDYCNKVSYGIKFHVIVRYKKSRVFQGQPI
jgi:hypothetical protein